MLKKLLNWLDEPFQPSEELRLARRQVVLLEAIVDLLSLVAENTANGNEPTMHALVSIRDSVQKDSEENS